MRKYKCYYQADLGYCAMAQANGFWQQCSLWYTTLNRLNAYWGKRNGIFFTNTKATIEY